MAVISRIKRVPSSLLVNSRIQIAIVFFANLLTLVFRAHLDPDATHDGIIYPAGLVVSQGGIPNRDVFTQYGPFTHLLHGFWLTVTEPNLLSLRYFTALLLASSFTLTFHVIKTKLGPYLSFFLVLGLNLSAPLFLPSLLPWPSVITTLITMITLVTFQNIDLKKNSKATQFAVAIIFFITTLGVFIRIHMVVNLTLLALLLVYFGLKSKIPSSWSLFALFGFLASSGLAFLYFSLTNSWNEFIYQSIEFPFQSFGEKDGFFTFRQLILYLTNLYSYLLAIVVLGLLVLILGKAASANRLNSLGLVYFFLFLIAALVVSRITPETSSFKNPVYLLVYSSTSVLQTLNLLTIVVSLWVVLKNFLRWRFLDWNQFLGLVTGIAVFTQLYPAPDPLHVWWIAPVLVSVISMQTDSNKLRLLLKPRIRAVRILLVGVLVILSCQQLLINSQPRAPYKTDFLNGMSGTVPMVTSIDRTLMLLEEEKRLYRIEYQCGEGIFSVAGNYFDTRDPYFLDILNSPVMTKSGDRAIFMCGISRDELRQYSQESKWKIIFQVKRESDRVNALVTKVPSN
jgi:hypothetical protein